MSIDLVLLQPKGTTKKYTRSSSIYPPLGLCQISAMLPEERVYILDAEGLNLSDEDTKKEILNMKPRILGMTTTSFTIDNIEKWSIWAKENNIVVIVGGPHATINPEDLFIKCQSVDYVVRGEAEEIIEKLIDDIINNKIPDYPGVCYKRDNQVVISEVILRINDLSEIPFPRVSGLPIKNYYCPDAKETPMMLMQLSRGCPNGCAFCSASFVQGKKIRYFSTNAIIDQLEYLANELNIKEISFVDDGFTTNKKMALEICNGIIERNIKLSWFCNARADCLNEDLVKKMKQAGCHQIYIGCESGNNEILKSVNKNITINQLFKASELLHKYDIDLSVGFIIGLPGETFETVKESVNLAIALCPNKTQFSRFVSLPGSKLFNEVGPNSYLFHQKYDDEIGNWIKFAYNQINYAS